MKVKSTLVLSLLCVFCFFSCRPKKGKETGGVIAGRSAQTLRFAAFAVKDSPPTPSEASAYLTGGSSLDDMVNLWKSTPDHLGKVRRYFDDLFAIGGLNGLLFEYRLSKNAAGILNLDGKPDCTAVQAVSLEVWWLPSGQVDKFCPGSVSDLSYVDGSGNKNGCWELGDTGRNNSKCGCGPLAILCTPNNWGAIFEDSLSHEARERGLYVFQNKLTWDDLVYGDFFYGNQINYYYYLWAGGDLFQNKVTPQQAADTLRQFSGTEFKRLPFPTGGKRAGIVTSPAFLSQFNNFRSRTRALTQSLLCQDISPSLNTDGIQKFVNPSLKATDVAHGSKPGCAACHYAMDNIGSTLLRYDQEANFLWHEDPLPAETGYIFGAQGEGPAHLGKSYVQNSPLFAACMAKSAWRSFTGLNWETLSQSTQSVLIAAAKQNPTTLINAILVPENLH